jgi:O-antigen ligase
MFHINILKLLLAITAATGLLFAVWTFADTGIKKYVMSRYEERFTKKGVNAEDRFIIWGRALRFIEDHPTGVGWSLYVDEIRKSPHNDYFVYAIAYSVFGGILYLFVLVRVGFSLIRGPKGVRETPHHLAVRMAGLGVTVAVLINSLSDHLTANRWYFNVVWSILWFSFFASGVTATGNMSTSDCRSATWHYSETSSSFQRDQQ